MEPQPHFGWALALGILLLALPASLRGDGAKECAVPYGKLARPASWRAKAVDAAELLTGYSVPTPSEVRDAVRSEVGSVVGTPGTAAKTVILGPPRFLVHSLLALLSVSPRWKQAGPLPARDLSLLGWRPFPGSDREIPAALVQAALATRGAAAALPRGLLRLLLPGFVRRSRDPAQALLHRHWLNPSEKTGPEDLKTLKEHGRLDDYLRQAEFVAKFPALHRFLSRTQRWGGRALTAPYWLIAALALQNALEGLTHDEDNPGLEDYLKDPKFRPGEDEVQILVNPVPFPHLAVRIGDRVYSYGVTHLTSSPVETYLNPDESRRLQERILAAFDRFDELPPERQALLRNLVSEEDVRRIREGQAPPDFSGRSAKEVADALGFSSLPRTFQMVTLKVGKTERDRMLRYLEMQKGKRYDNKTFVNDCATMIFRAMGIENPVVDPSPSLIVTTFQARKALGDDRVRKTFTVYGAGTPRSKSLLIRDAYINYREASLHYALLPFNLPQRVYMDATYRPDDYQKWDPEVRREIESWREDVRRMEEEENGVQLYRRMAGRLAELDPADPATKGKKERLKRLVDEYLAKKREAAERDYRAPETLLKDAFLATYRLEVYRELEREIYGKLGYGNPRAPSPK